MNFHDLPRIARKLSSLLGWAMWMPMVLAPMTRLPAADAPGVEESLAGLRRLVEEQNHRIEELTRKVRLLEERAPGNEGVAPFAATNAAAATPSGAGSTAAMAPEIASKPVTRSATETPKDSARVPDSPRLVVGAEGFALQSSDTNFVLRLRGLLQVDSRTFLEDDGGLDGNDGFVIRRARPILEATLYRDFDMQLVPDFAGNAAQLFDASITYRLRTEVQVRVGKFKLPVGLEQLQSDAAGLFNERGFVSQLIPARNTGAQVSGELAEGILRYAGGLFGAAGDGRNSSGLAVADEPELAGRLIVEPWRNSSMTTLRGLGVGVGASFSEIRSNAVALPATSGGTLPGYTTAGSQQFFAYNPTQGSVVADGAHWRLSPQAYWYRGPVGVLGEYLISDQEVLNTSAIGRRADLQNRAWQVSAQWVLTGESAGYGMIMPRRNFDPRHGGWGAWQLAARYGELSLDPETFSGFANPQVSARRAAAWSLGINWSLNRNLRVLTSYSQTRFEGAEGGPGTSPPSLLTAPGVVTQEDEKVFLTRVQLLF